MEFSGLNQLALLGAIQGGILATVLWRKKYSNKKASLFLSLLLLLTTLVLLGKVFYETAFLQHFWAVYTLTDIVLYLFGPLIYFFTYALLKQKLPIASKNWRHFVPALIHLFVFVPIIMLTIADLITWVNGYGLRLIYYGLEFFAIISLGAYAWKSIRLFQRFESKYYGLFSFPVLAAFLKPFLYFFFGLSVIWLLAFLFRISGIVAGYEAIGYYGFWTLAAISTYLMSYKILLNPALLNAAPLPQILSEVTIDAPETAPLIINELAKAQLIALLQQSKIYKHPKLSLETLAQEMDLNRHELSKIINRGFNKSFFDLINGYRIEEFLKTYPSGKYQTFLELAYEVGFNSKSAFNRAFRKETGKSPSDYFNNETLLKRASV